MTKTTIEQQFKIIPLKEIKPDPEQPRKFFNERAMLELSASIKSKGVLQPVLIRPAKKGYILVCGERRFRAAKEAKLTEIPAVIRDLSDEEALELQIIENLQRKDVHPMEEAVAFASLADKFTPEELSLRVGKSASYVAKRIKLTDLIEEAQEYFYDDHMTYSQALQLARLDPSLQKEILKEELPPKDHRKKKQDWKLGNIDWIVNRNSLDLSGAIFKTNDANLYPEAGACNKCPFNSANQPLLFDENKKRICSKPSCFNIKTHRAKKLKFEAVAANPDILCITDGYYLSDDQKESIKAAKDAGVNILDSNLYENFYQADPSLSFDEWKEDNYGDMDDEDVSESEMREEYDAYVKENEKELKEQEELLKSGALVKAYVIAGYDEGKEKLIKLKLGAKVVAAIVSGNAGDAEILNEIDKIEQREKRNKELDDIKVWTEIRQLYNSEEVKKKIFDTKEFSNEEIHALSIALAEKISYLNKHNWGIEASLKRNQEMNGKFTELGMREFARMFLHDALVSDPQFDLHTKKGSKNGIVYTVLKSYLPFEIEVIENNQKGIAEERSKRVQKRINALRKKLEVPVE